MTPPDVLGSLEFQLSILPDEASIRMSLAKIVRAISQRTIPLHVVPQVAPLRLPKFTPIQIPAQPVIPGQPVGLPAVSRLPTMEQLGAAAAPGSLRDLHSQIIAAAEARARELREMRALRYRAAFQEIPIGAVSSAIEAASRAVAAAGNQFSNAVHSASMQVAKGFVEAAEAVAGAAAETTQRVDEEVSDLVRESAQRTTQETAAIAEDSGQKIASIRQQISEGVSALVEAAVPKEAIRFAAQQVRAGKTSIEQAIHAVTLGLREPAKVLETVGIPLEEAAKGMMHTLALTSKLDVSKMVEVATKLGVSVGSVTTAVQAATAALQNSAKGAGAATMSLRSITAALRAELAGMGVMVSTNTIRLAALMVQQGVIGFSEAATALAQGAGNATEAFRVAGVSAQQAAKVIAGAWKQLLMAGAAPPAAPPGGPPETVVPGGMLPAAPEETLKLAGALSSAQAAGRSLMHTLLSLRWQVFTVIFFFILLQRAIGGLARSLVSGAQTVTHMTGAIRLLRSSGVQDVRSLIQELVEASGYYLTMEEAARKLSRFAVLRMPPEIIAMMPQLMRYARIFAAVTDEMGNAEQVFDKMVDAIGRGQMRMAATIGVTAGTMRNLLDEYKSWAVEARDIQGPLQRVKELLDATNISVATSTEQLSAQQKQLLMLWKIMTIGEPLIEALGDDFDRATVEIQEADNAIAEIKNSILALLATMGAPVLKGLAANIKSVTGSYAMLFDLAFRRETYEQKMEAATRAAFERLRALTAEERERLKREALFASTFLPVMLGLTAAKGLGKQAAEDLLLFHLAAQEYMVASAFEMQKGAAAADKELGKLMEQFRAIIDTSGETAGAIGDVDQALRNLEGTVQSMADVWVDYQREIEDATIEHQRWLEDTMAEHQRRLEEIERDYRNEHQKERRQHEKREADERNRLAERLWEIDRQLADRRRSIWRDYYDELFMIELNRDALSAMLAARRRDRQLAEAMEWAQREREEAHRRYQQQIEDERRAYEDRLREIDDRHQQELEELRRWLQREQEERDLRERREAEDRRRAYQRRYEDLTRALYLEYEVRRIQNDQTLTEEERFLRTLQVIFGVYSASFSAEAREIYRSLEVGASSYFSWLYQIFLQYYRQMIQYRNAMAPLFQLPSPRGGGTRAPYHYPIEPLAKGGALIATGPTRLLVGEAGPEVVVAVPLGRFGAAIRHQFSATIWTKADDITGRVDAAVYRALQNVAAHL